MHAVAYPILERHGFPATVFLVSSAVGTRNSWDGDGALGRRTLLDWPAIHAMRAGGIAYGAHSRSHRALTEVPAHELDDVVTGCRTDLETALGESVAAFAEPYGTDDARTAAAVEHAGFHGACGVRDGVNTVATPSYALHRTEVFGTDSLLRFALAVSLGDPLRQLGRRASQ